MLINFWKKLGDLQKTAIWQIDNVEDVLIHKFDGLPRIFCPHHNITILECFIEWETPQDNVNAVLSTTAVDIGPENPYQEVFFIHQSKRKTKYFHSQPTHKIPYKIQCYELDTAQFKIIPIGTSELPKIKTILLKIEITDARIQ